MREILFRGKETSDGTWAEGYYMKHTTSICGSDSGSFHSIHTKPLDPETGERVVEVSPETVGQFTGLFDKNGKKIFEGDIVHGNLPDLSYESDRIGVAKWGDFGWIVEFNVPEWKMPRIGFCSFGDVEVIGNIYDNPELLEVVK